MSRSWKRVHICSTNDHPKDNDKVRRWVEHAGGRYSTALTSDITHLLCSKHAWKSYSDIVREARRTKRIKIVRFEWLVDSLTKYSAKAKNKPLTTAKYEWEQRKIIGARRQQASDGGSDSTSNSSAIMQLEQLEETGRSFSLALQKLDAHMSAAGFEPYTDSLNFTYTLSLLRRDTSALVYQHNVRLPLSPPSLHLPATLNPCPLPLHSLPPGPLADLPAILPPYRLERSQRKVTLTSLAVFALQLYVESAFDDSERSRSSAKRFVLVTVGVHGGGRVVAEDVTSSPMGEETAMRLWGAVFKGRTGWMWNGSGGVGTERARREESVAVMDEKECLWRAGEWGARDGDVMEGKVVDPDRSVAGKKD